MIDTQSLKNKILDLAIRGKLTRQLPDDGTAEELYEKIQEEKQALVEAGKIKKEKPLKEIEKDEVPFEIPENWKWVHWGNLAESIQYGYNAPAKESGRTKMVRISDIQDNEVMWDNVPFCDISEDEIKGYLLHENDILFARTGHTVGKSYIVRNVPPEAIFAGYLIRTSYSKKLCPKYMKFYMESNLYWHQLKSGTIATAQPNCNGKTLSKMVLPLPPMFEQERIVTVVEKLFAEIATIEKLQTQYAADAEILKSKLIDAAIQGKLTEQLPSDGTAEELYQQIQTEKQALISAGKIKKEKPLKEIEEDEIPFEIPESWKWVRLEQVTYSVGNKTNQIKTNDVKPDGEIPVVSQGQKMIDGYCDEKEKIITDIPLVMFGDHTRIVKYIDFPFVIGADGTKFHHCISVNPKYFYYWMLHATAVLRDKGYARHYSLLKKQLIPLPPMAEQKRIVEVIERLFKVFA